MHAARGMARGDAEGAGGEGVAFNRVRWHCRRGLLELDLVLGRFLEHEWPGLTAQERDAFVRLLELPDNDLWDIASARRDVDDPQAASVVARLRAA
jgi:succinate dehydrogenase flavin-adding protein (antitoxin of CptAB toxin-antitoxin module)